MDPPRRRTARGGLGATVAPPLVEEQTRAMTRCMLAVVLILTAAAGCGGEAPSERDSDTRPVNAGGLPGRLVEIGGGRSLFANCVGSGSPAVVLESGGGTNGFQWRAVQ